MNWDELFQADKMPSPENMREFIGAARPLWDELILHIEETYKAKSQIDYSNCSAQPGWNMKYKKSGKSLCTLYPMDNYFIALIVVGKKEETEVEAAIAMGAFNDYVKNLYQNTPFSAMGRWLMLEVKDKSVLSDIKTLIGIRMSKNTR